MPSTANAESIQYRTFIRVSFEQEQQRSDPAAYWNLWKTSRGLHELQKPDKLRAVEYAGEHSTRIHIESVSLDGFSITWTINPAERIYQCSIPVRFNFLSTDFTLSKGVRGTPVRLCAKTKQLGEVDISQEPEVYFCNVKLFRDHGAERKLSNDVTGIQKRIEKLKLQMKEPALPEPSKKRKRGSTSGKPKTGPCCSKSDMQREVGLPMDIHDSPQHDVHYRLQKMLDALQRSVFSSRPESVLSLRAENQDDPELHPSPPFDVYGLQDDAMHRSDSYDSASIKSGSGESKGPHSPSTVSSLRGVVNTGISTTWSKPEQSTIPGKIRFASLSTKPPLPHLLPPKKN